MEFEVGVHDDACKGRLHSHVPFIGRMTLTVWQKTYNDIHGYYRAWVEHLFACLWSWRVVHDIWLGSHEDFCCFCHVHMCFPRGGFQGGHGNIELLFGAARALCMLCRNISSVLFPSILVLFSQGEGESRKTLFRSVPPSYLCGCSPGRIGPPSTLDTVMLGKRCRGRGGASALPFGATQRA